MSNKKPRYRIACIGEAMVELTLGQDSSAPVNLGFAGDSLNTAIYLKRLLGDTAEVTFITILGRDPLSARMIDFLHSESIDTSAISYSSDRLVGLYAITTDQNGERSFCYWRNDSAARTLFQVNGSFDFSVLHSFDILYLSAITLAILPAEARYALLDALATYRQQHAALVAFDSNYRPQLWESTEAAQQSIADAWQITDIALPSVDDETALFGDANERATITRLKSYGISLGALKRGERGPLSLSTDISSTNEKLLATRDDWSCGTVIDTTAAGDSFNAGYLSAAVQKHSDDQALHAGHDCAVRVIAHSGAIVPKEKW